MILLILIPLAMIGFVWFVVKARRTGRGFGGAPYYGGVVGADPHDDRRGHDGGWNSCDSNEVGDSGGGGGGDGGGGGGE